MTRSLSHTIRPATPADCASIVKMIHELAVYERLPEECHATPEALRDQLFGEKPPAEALVAEIEGGQLVGYAIYCHNFSTWECRAGLWIEDIYVRPTARGRGVGKALFVACAAVAKDRDCARVEFSVLDWNKPSLDFYKSMGAAPMDEWTTQRMEREAIAALING